MPSRAFQNATGNLTSNLTTSGAITASSANVTGNVIVSGSFNGNVSVTGTVSANNANIAGTLAMGSSFLRNKIINGDMRIDQRYVGTSISFSGANVLFPADRFFVGIYGTTYSNPSITAQQVTDAPTGFTNSIKVTSASTITADANKLGAWFSQRIEGLNMADLNWGTASAQSATLQFRVKASKTGVMSVAFENAIPDRSYLTTVNINQANTWEYKTITIPGDTTGTWFANTGQGMAVTFGIYSNGTWLAGTGGSWSGTRALLSTSQTNFIASSGDNIAITGVQLEAGTVATPFERRPFGQELTLCQRYYQKSYSIGTVPGTATATGIRTATVLNSGALTRVFILPANFPVTMRTTPNIVSYGQDGTINAISLYNDLNIKWTVSSVDSGGDSSLGTFITLSTNAATNNAYYFHFTASAEI